MMIEEPFDSDSDSDSERDTVMNDHPEVMDKIEAEAMKVEFGTRLQNPRCRQAPLPRNVPTNCEISHLEPQWNTIQDPKKLLDEFLTWAVGKPTAEAQAKIVDLVTTNRGLIEVFKSEWGLEEYESDDDILAIFKWEFIQDPEIEDREMYASAPLDEGPEYSEIDRLCELCNGTGQEILDDGRGTGLTCSYCGGEGYRNHSASGACHKFCV